MSKSIVLGGGCFWCIEAVYLHVKGVESVRSGYAGGSLPDPIYWNHGDHAEAIEVTYDETQIDLKTLLEIFWTIHNPTTLNRQGADIGTSYRSIILYSDDSDRDTINWSIKEVAPLIWDDPIVTEVKKVGQFYEAEANHQDFYNQNQGNPYCQIVIDPKLSKFKEKFADYIKHD